ncbi:MAG: hypothetical protein NTY36_14180 [Deltaproteobacteria bacterium]|nr:hypothetical protein [Deltaproteobacteria bacterium]
MKSKQIVFGLMVLSLTLIMGNAAWGAQGGDILWEKTISYSSNSPQSYNQVATGGTIASPTSFIVAGTAKNIDNTGGQLAFLKAYDVATGNFKWGGDLSLGTTNSISILGLNGNICLVRNFSVTPYSGQPSQVPLFSLYISVMRAYNADTGDLLWENSEDFFSPSGTTVPNTPVFQALPNRFFVTGFYLNAGGAPQQSTLIVRAYQDRTVVLQNSLLLD